MNVIVFMSDTFRYDNLSCYRPGKIKTPRLDEFANQSTIFNNAYCGSYPTIPCRLDLWSGNFSFIDYDWCPLPKETVTLQQVLSASGITTQLIADNPHLVEMGFNYERGFMGWEWIRGQETDTWKSSARKMHCEFDPKKIRSKDFLMKQIVRNTAWWRGEEDRFVARTVKSAIDWLEENQDLDSFYLMIDTFDPHEPWDAPQNYIDLYDSDYQGKDVSYPHYNFWRKFLTEAELNRTYNLYSAETTLVDHWFGVLMDKLAELGMDEDTVVIFVSDHGYLFGEHDLMGKSILTETDGGGFVMEGIPIYDELRRIPLLVRLPGEAKGKVINSLVQIPDLMPTIMELLGLVTTQVVGGKTMTQALQCGMFFTEQWEFQPDRIHGKSLMPLMRGEVNKQRNIAVSSSTLIHPISLLAKCAIVTDDGWCLHYAGSYGDQKKGSGGMFTMKVTDPSKAQLSGKPELYHIVDDPHEQINLFEDNQALARDIHSSYVHWLKEAGTPEAYLNGRLKLV